MKNLFMILLVISSIGIIIATNLMEPKQQGMGGSYGQDTNVFGRTANKAKEALLQKITIISAVVFMLSAILVTVL